MALNTYAVQGNVVFQQSLCKVVEGFGLGDALELYAIVREI